MDESSDAWKRRWREGNIGFHQEDTNAQLIQFWSGLVPDECATVLVPLCGKTLDMLWLRSRGHRVVGVELSELAARAFFDEAELNARETRRGEYLVLDADGVEIWVGDFFSLTPDMIGTIDAWFDRAAIVALEPSLRRWYAEQISSLLHDESIGFMLTFEYPSEERDGPPFSVSFQDVEEAFSGLYRGELLDCLDLTEGNRWQLSRVLKPVVSLRR